MIAGIYGMNFHFMPELDSRWGYPTVRRGMVLICLFLYHVFRNRNWL
ncbi:magnesium and cobalt transporter [Mycobacterium tuberculosis]|uniref:Magnesium and cobalt transporter n=1 Tax=Mycobacterium tuberculosis TaxID=1773 RepID=A0A654ZW09_MYCTX|nr:magnesium and cobalt transporter [Mycobacterium tuberculosis]